MEGRGACIAALRSVVELCYTVRGQIYVYAHGSRGKYEGFFSSEFICFSSLHERVLDAQKRFNASPRTMLA